MTHKEAAIMEEPQKIYDSELNVSISWLRDGGIEVKLGDEMNGYAAETNVNTSGRYRVVTAWWRRKRK